ncbi:MAG: hypothetical protein L0Z47_10960 [Actinobacteria bacterium]|nr:hypothetical protein [Actinomycetota bacterium]
MPDRRRARRRAGPPILSFGDWDELPAGSVVQVCHPHWRGVRTATYGFGSLVIECSDLGAWRDVVIAGLVARRPSCVVVQGWPPGSAEFVRALGGTEIPVKAVLHSSPAQHGAEAGEAKVADEVLGLAKVGVLAEVGMVKAGVAEAFRRLGYPVSHVPNRAPVLPTFERRHLGPGLNVGVFAEPFWRKNVTTQLLAVALMGSTRSHVLKMPDNAYLGDLEVVEHGLLPYGDFIALQGSVDLNLYVTLSECHPLSPQESYLAGVPCLISRSSAVFLDDPILWEMTTVADVDNPSSIAGAALALHAHRAEAVERATGWITAADDQARALWKAFVGVDVGGGE